MIKDNESLKNHFEIKDDDKIQNKNAFVEILQDDYEDIQKFLTAYHDLSNNDFELSFEKEDKKEEK